MRSVTECTERVVRRAERRGVRVITHSCVTTFVRAGERGQVAIPRAWPPQMDGLRTAEVGDRLLNQHIPCQRGCSCESG